MNEKLKQIGTQLRTQDNLGTKNPAFCVQVMRRIGPIIPGYGSGEICFHNRGDVETYYHDGPDRDKWEQLKALYDDSELDETEYIVSGYNEVWSTVQVCLTRTGAEEHLNLNGHNYRIYDGVRIYVESFFRNPEMTAIRDALIETAREGQPLSPKEGAKG